MLVCLVVACTKPNPRSCADGICSDPAFPFCDADGALEGSPGTCIAVDCTPKELVACLGGQELRCNAAGNDLDVIDCPLGCLEASGGCVTCSSNDQCDNPTPICDVAIGSCHGCSADDECDSRVCDAASGSCVEESAIVYASPTGGQPPCALQTPCALGAAITVATGSATPIFLRMLPGSYAVAFDVGTPTPAPLKVVATGATLIAPGSFDVHDGANVEVRGLIVQTSGNGSELDCKAPITVPMSTLTLDAVTVNVADAVDQISAFNCRVRVTNSDITINASAGSVDSSIALHIADNASLEGDRLRIHVAPGFTGRARATATTTKTLSVRITNSIIEDARAHLTTNSSAPNTLTMMFNTFIFTDVDPNTDDVACFGFAGETNFALFQNNIFFSTTATEPRFDPKCRYANNLVFPFTGSLPGNTFANPQFINAAGKDFHLGAASPAVDTATAPMIGLDTTHDFEGAPRPQGPKSDIGAFERAP
jgi:hypothetical protein